MSEEAIILKGVRTHNLKNVDVKIPHNQLVVITGVSGSGKSSLAFDTLYAEGQRRYVESLSAYARQFLERMEKPDVDFVQGILPAIAIEAKNPISNARSTVGTQTEINDYLRILFARIGKTYCSGCGRIVEIEEPEKVAEQLLTEADGHAIIVLFPVIVGSDSRKYAKEFLTELTKQGFLRALTASGQLKPLSENLFEDAAADSVQIVADRLLLEKSKKARLVESLELAYRYGKNFLFVLISPEKTNSLPSEDTRLKDWNQKVFSNSFHCAYCKKDYPAPTPHMFSFNSPLGACAECQGFGRVIDIDWNLVVPDAAKSLADGAIEPWTKPSTTWEFGQLKKFCQKKRIPWTKPFRELAKEEQGLILYGAGENSSEDFFSVRNFFEYLEKKTYKMHIRIFLSKYRGYFLCPSCSGSRLKPDALGVKVSEKNIYELSQFTLKDLQVFVASLELTDHEKQIVGPVLIELAKRIKFLNDVGLGYLTLSRLSRTLSGGEAQRINLATSLGSSLVDTLYVLDEPSIGLHERDNQLLINLLKELKSLGNTVAVVEHDESMIRMADQVIDLGPFAGAQGGKIIFHGGVSDLLKSRESLTAKYLRGDEKIERDSFLKAKKKEEKSETREIVIRGAREHNLKNITVAIPLGQFCVVTGVSGSGKSTLLYDVLYNNYLRFKGRPVSDIGACEAIDGFEFIDDMVLIDQSPIGRTPRSNPVTYLKAFDDIRQIFAATSDAKRRRLGPGAFSFNVSGGRCEVCEGDGKIRVEMHFMADVFIECEKCAGTRYQSHILEVKYKTKNIHQVLNLTVDEAIEFFHEHKKLVVKLLILKKVGLGYLRLGQSAVTLSAGEAQRLKLALELVDQSRSNLLYIFDEPTVGLHYHDIKFLIKAFDELLARGNSLLVIEHNLDVIRIADHVIDLGPEGGAGGGEVLYSGPLSGISGVKRSYTGQFLTVRK
ncbi:MAG: excinuclease ABC subunit UvrA [Candidatus Omnitrophica bacterium]|nr:excinuclease ABC subunit UvrA [Candidatus Omnitrophota bacterium]